LAIESDWKSYEAISVVYLSLKFPKLRETFAESLASRLEFVYRSDSRSIEKKVGGFNPWVEDLDPRKHAEGISIKNKISAHVSTSLSLDVAEEVGENSENGGFIYKLLKPKNGINVNAQLGNSSPFPGEKEIAVPGNIPSSKIKSVKKIESN